MVNDKKAVVLLVTLWILAILSLLAIGIGFRTSVDLKLVSNQIDTLKAFELAKAGVIKAVSGLEWDEKKDSDTLWECGISLKENETFDGKFKNVRIREGAEGYFDISAIEDLQGKVNINTAPGKILAELFQAAPDAGEIADNIRAWRGDSGQDAPGSGAKDYSDKPYACKNAPFDVASELLLVKGITQEMYFGESEGQGLKDLVTVYGPKEFKININTAGQKVLEIVFSSLGLDVSAAENIVRYRAGDDIESRDDNMVFSDATQVHNFLKSADGGDLDQETLVDFEKIITFNSSYFKFCSTGNLERKRPAVRKSITCVVERELASSPPHKTSIISWFEE